MRWRCVSLWRRELLIVRRGNTCLNKHRVILTRMTHALASPSATYKPTDGNNVEKIASKTVCDMLFPIASPCCVGDMMSFLIAAGSKPCARRSSSKVVRRLRFVIQWPPFAPRLAVTHGSLSVMMCKPLLSTSTAQGTWWGLSPNPWIFFRAATSCLVA